MVFRYIMANNWAARLFLSAVLGKAVEALVFSLTDYSRKLGGKADVQQVLES